MSAVPSGRKAGAGALASAAKEAAKEIVRAAEDGAGKARRRLQPMELGSARVENPTSTPFRSILADILHDGFSCGLRMCFLLIQVAKGGKDADDLQEGLNSVVNLNLRTC